jgi:hypothetical protein
MDDLSELTEAISALKKDIANEQTRITLIPGYPFKD